MCCLIMYIVVPNLKETKSTEQIMNRKNTRLYQVIIKSDHRKIITLSIIHSLNNTFFNLS